MMPVRRNKGLGRSLDRHLIAGLLSAILFLTAIGAWAMTTSLSGAVIATGFLVVEGNVKKVQHPKGGVVGELLVGEGRAVDAGEILIKLDDTVIRAKLDATKATLDQLYARKARLLAELSDAASVEVPAPLVDRLPPADRDAIMQAERRLFADRRAEREGQKERLDGQAVQLEEQVSGLSVQMTAKQDEIALIGREAEAQDTLYAKNLTSLSQVLALKREAVRLNGEFGQLRAQIAATKARIEEIGLQKIQIDQAMRAEVSTELRDLETREGELRSDEIALIEDLQRVDIRAPVAGIVHKLAVHTAGGVVSPAEALMEIVPREAELVVRAQVRPDDVDQLAVGQPARVRFTAFNRNTTPEFDGRLVRVSADLEVDERTGLAFYRADIGVDKADVGEHAGLELVPGMPAEAYVLTGDRNVLSWLMKPITDHAARAMREE
ncbi:MAG: HlyD family type I secretion periplasmic adaptor subunit [Arenimonas sp.]|nr:HlyD family type I secretion periplasmic adaptor subunit [Rhizobium sp.]MBW8445770.1 HlyD family type I secretion periplasmic adaptor subunit [Arenimonas sp.]